MSTLRHDLARFSHRVFLCNSSDALCSFTRTSLFLSLQVLVHSFLMSSLRSSMGTIGRLDGFKERGIHLIIWQCIGNNILGTKAEADICVGRSLRKTGYHARLASHMKIPCPCPFEQVLAEVEAGIWVPHVELVIPELTSKLARHIRLDRTGVTLMNNAISGSNTHQLAQDTSREGRIPI